ncbi:hypothetical protein GGH14_001901 [Coemansia sp. RSA 370]|nr:hypothetical protein GGH14_001901 [Coemansia sp. RSA 370]
MLQTAREAASDIPIEYVEAPSENLSFINDHLVNVIAVATGAHWFKPNEFVSEAIRVLKPSMDFEVTWHVLEDFWKTTSAVSHHVDMFPDQENPATVLVRELMAAAGASDIDKILRVQWGETLLMCHPPLSDNFGLESCRSLDIPGLG